MQILRKLMSTNKRMLALFMAGLIFSEMIATNSVMAKEQILSDEYEIVSKETNISSEKIEPEDNETAEEKGSQSILEEESTMASENDKETENDKKEVIEEEEKEINEDGEKEINEDREKEINEDGEKETNEDGEKEINEDEEKNLVEQEKETENNADEAQMEEESGIEEYYQKDFSFQKKVGKTLIKVEAPMGVLPDEAEVKIKLLTASNTKKKVENLIEDVKVIDEKEEISVVGLNIYDISIWFQDKEIQPREDCGKVTVSFSQIQMATKEKEMDEVSSLKVFHIDDKQQNAEEMQLTKDDSKEEIEFETEHFSIYAIAAVGGSVSYGAGTNRSIVLPAGEYTIEARGAGGGAAYDTCYQQGGNGGYASGIFRFTEETTLNLIAGTGGSCHHGNDANQSGSGGYPGGGEGYLRPGGYGAASGGGGGYTAISAKGQYLVVAGGGGGGDTSSDQGGQNGGPGGGSGSNSGMNGSNGGYSHNQIGDYGYFALGGGGGGYHGGGIHNGGSSYVSPKAIIYQYITGGGGSGATGNGGSGSGGSIVITWNQCSHGSDVIMYTPLGDYTHHKITCTACDTVLSDEDACTDENEDGYCDFCGHRTSPYFKNNSKETKTVVYAAEEEISFTVEPEVMTGFSAKLQWYCKHDEAEKLLEGETKETLKIDNQTLQAGVYEYFCRMFYEGYANGVKVSAVKTIIVEKAPAYIWVEKAEMEREYGEKEDYHIAYSIFADEEYKKELFHEQKHGGKFIFTSTDESVATAYTDAEGKNSGQIHIKTNHVGTAILTYAVTEGNNYQSIDEGAIEVKIDKTGITSFQFLQVPTKIQYLQENNIIKYAYLGKDERADGKLELSVQKVNQYDDKEVLEANLLENEQKIKISPKNAGIARVSLCVVEEGRDYKDPIKSGYRSNTIYSSLIEVTRADGTIEIISDDINNNTIKLYKTYGSQNQDETKEFLYCYNGNNDPQNYGKGQILVKTENDEIVTVYTNNAKSKVTLVPKKAGITTLTLYATEGINYTECQAKINIDIKNRILENGLLWDFVFTKENEICITGVKKENGEEVKGNLEIPESFVLDEKEVNIVEIGKGTFGQNSSVSELTVSATVKRIETDAIDSKIKIITQIHTAAEAYAKQNKNQLMIKMPEYCFDVNYIEDRWKADHFNTTLINNVKLKIPAFIDDYEINSIDDNISLNNVKEIELENSQLYLPEKVWNLKDILIKTNYYSFETAGEGKIKEVLAEKETSSQVIPEHFQNVPILTLNRNSIKKITKEIVFHCASTTIPSDFFFSDGNGFTEREVGLNVIFTDISFTIGIKENGEIVIENYNCKEEKEIIIIPQEIFHTPINSVSEELANKNTQKVSFPTDEMQVPEEWFEKYPGLVIEKPSYSYTIGEHNNVEEWKPTDCTGTVTIPDIVDGHIVTGIHKDAIGAETEHIIINNPSVEITEEHLEHVTHITAEIYGKPYIIGVTETGKKGIVSYNTSDKKGIIDVPEKLVDIPIVSVSEDLADETTKKVIIRGEITEIPIPNNWPEKITVVVIKNSCADLAACQCHFEIIRYLAIGGIEAYYQEKEILVGEKIQVEKVIITAYYDVEKKEMGVLKWEDLTGYPEELTIKTAGDNGFSIDYYGQKAKLYINGYELPNIKSTNKSHDKKDNNKDNNKENLNEIQNTEFENIDYISQMPKIEEVKSLQNKTEENSADKGMKKETTISGKRYLPVYDEVAFKNETETQYEKIEKTERNKRIPITVEGNSSSATVCTIIVVLCGILLCAILAVLGCKISKNNFENNRLHDKMRKNRKKKG